jgi:hypothetical protein
VLTDASPALAAQLQPFDQRACFIAGPAKSGTTLLVSLLDGHPELLVLPEETAYFPTILTKYAPAGRRAQFDYLTQRTLANVLFGGRCKWGRRDYSHFPTRTLLDRFEQAAFDPANAGRDLLAILMETYAGMLGTPLGGIRHWVEKTPANRDHLDPIIRRFPHCKILLTLRDPRALLASQILLEQSRQQRRFSIYLTIRHWRTAARLALRQQAEGAFGDRVLVVGFQRLVEDPETWMRRVCCFLGIDFRQEVLTPTKMGKLWTGNSAAGRPFEEISREPVERWRSFLTQDEIGWVEFHCHELMEELGYQPILKQRRVRHWANPVRGETPREYLKSRFYSLRRWKLA